MTSDSPRAEADPAGPDPSNRLGVEAQGGRGTRLGDRVAERLPAPDVVVRALIWGSVVALTLAIFSGLIRKWVWVLGLEPIALGLVIGEAAAVPSTSRHRRPPLWSYFYIVALGTGAYALIHLVFWWSSQGVWPAESFFSFLRAAPSATAAPLFQEVDLARQIALATGGTSELKYWIWATEAGVMGLAALLAYRGGSVRRLRT